MHIEQAQDNKLYVHDDDGNVTGPFVNVPEAIDYMRSFNRKSGMYASNGEMLRAFAAIGGLLMALIFFGFFFWVLWHAFWAIS